MLNIFYTSSGNKEPNKNFKGVAYGSTITKNCLYGVLMLCIFIGSYIFLRSVVSVSESQF